MEHETKIRLRKAIRQFLADTGPKSSAHLQERFGVDERFLNAMLDAETIWQDAEGRIHGKD